jgi:plastocyanin
MGRRWNVGGMNDLFTSWWRELAGGGFWLGKPWRTCHHGCCMNFPLRYAWLLCGLTSPFALAHAGGSVQGSVVIETMRPAPSRPGYAAPATKQPVKQAEALRALVYLERDSKAYPPLRTGDKVSIRQEGYQFRPSMLAVQVGTLVSFPNLDDEFHNVLSLTRPNAFDLGRYQKDAPVPKQVFKKPGLVKIYCDIHAHMRCFLLVLETPWFTTTDAAGRFNLKNIPAGEYTLRVLQPSERRLEQRITVREGAATTIHLQR